MRARWGSSTATRASAPRRCPGSTLSDDTALIDRAVREATAKGGTVIGTASTPDGPLRYIAVPIEMPGDPHKGVYVRAVKLESELGSVTSTITTYWIAAIAVLAAIGIVGWFVAGRLLSPIRSLRDAADSITISDLSPRLQAEGNDDISDLTRTVNSMLDRLEGSVDVQRQLLDDVRHELKTPITIVRGHLEMMDSHDVADVESAREIGIAELDRMTRLVDDIDLLAAVEGDQFAMDELDLGALTARTGELVAVIAGHDWRVEAIGTGSIRGDHDRLLQAWLQLADNAAKYTPDGSGIEIGSAMDDDGARLWVRDHGAGDRPRGPAPHLPPVRPGARQAHRRRIGPRPCHRRRHHEGARRAMRRHRHRRRRRDLHHPPPAPEHGAAPPRARRRRRAPAGGSRMTTILIVEDEQRIADFVSRGLQAAGYQTEIVDDGLEALERAQQPDIDLVLLDIGLPSMDGLEVLRELRGRGSAVPVIMLTARSSTRDTVEGLDAGASDYVPKPFTFDELLARVRSRLRDTVGSCTHRTFAR